jgi:hypothetical protein
MLRCASNLSRSFLEPDMHCFMLSPERIAALSFLASLRTITGSVPNWIPRTETLSERWLSLQLRCALISASVPLSYLIHVHMGL